jgi:hypothetical protein
VTESVEQEDDHEPVWASSVCIKSERLSTQNHSCPVWLSGSQGGMDRCSVIYYGSREEPGGQRGEPEQQKRSTRMKATAIQVSGMETNHST